MESRRRPRTHVRMPSTSCAGLRRRQVHKAHPVVHQQRCTFEVVRESPFRDGAVAARPKRQVSSARRDRGLAHPHGIVSSARMDGIPTHARPPRQTQGSSDSQVETADPAAPEIARMPRRPSMRCRTPATRSRGSTAPARRRPSSRRATLVRLDPRPAAFRTGWRRDGDRPVRRQRPSFVLRSHDARACRPSSTRHSSSWDVRCWPYDRGRPRAG
jgi:hypothetical protein